MTFALMALAVWRVTHALVYEAGPLDVISRLRGRISAHTDALTCFYCASVWVAVPLAVWAESVLHVAALSGAAILLERLTEPRDV